MFARGTRPSVAVLALLAVAAALAAGATGGLPASAPTSQPNAWTLCPAPGKFITCLLATDAALWVGTEDQSVWRLDLKADPAQPAAWKQFGTGDTKTDNCYGLAQDAAGRIWVGTQNQGVSVYNGQSWKNYGVIDGPIGEHVFSIAADPDPKRGTVWIATDHGLTSWTPEREDVSLEGRAPSRPAATTERGPPTGATGGLSASASTVDPFAAKGIADPNLAPGIWRSYTRGDGLPADQIYAVTVAANGRVWIGTECDGLAWSDPPYKTWTSIRAIGERSGDGPGQNGRAAIGFQPGLPSNLTNGLLALPDGTIAYSTNYGLGLSRDGGRSWTAWQGVSNMAYENYLRGLAADSAGGLWIATRHKGLVRLDLRTGRATGVAKPALPDDYVFDVAVTRDGSIWAGTYGGGLARLGPSTPVAAGAVPDSALHTPQSALSSDNAAAWKAFGDAMAGKTKSATGPASTEPPANTPTVGPLPPGRPVKTTTGKAPVRSPSAVPMLPAPAVVSLEEMNNLLAQMGRVPTLSRDESVPAVCLGDDWLTRGDWLGRYGRFASVLCAIRSPYSHFYGVGWQPDVTECIELLGAHRTLGDSVRYWVHALYTKNPNSLEMAPDYLASRIAHGLTDGAMNRRQAEIDDHGEVYPMTHQGPSLYLALRIPRGQFVLSLYFFNKDGDTAWNRWRDYLITVKQGRFTAASTYGDWMKSNEEAAFEAIPGGSRSRVRDFRGGVYKSFVVTGPGWYGVKIDRNHSFDTLLSGVMLDLCEEKPAPYYWKSRDGNATLGRLATVANEFVHKDGRGQYLADLNAGEDAAHKVMLEEYTRKQKDFQARFSPCSDVERAALSLIQEAGWMRLRNTAGWAAFRRSAYSIAGRYYAAEAVSPGNTDMWAISRKATCLYELQVFPAWEDLCRRLGIVTARDMELRAVDEYLKNPQLYLIE